MPQPHRRERFQSHRRHVAHRRHRCRQQFPVALAGAGAHSLIVMSDRELILEAVKDMPESATIREIMDELLMMETVRQRLEQNPKGKGIPAEEVLKQVSSWVTG